MVPGSLGCGSAVLAMIATLAPPAAARLAIARPKPRLAPEMNMVLPERDMATTLATLAAGAAPSPTWEQPPAPALLLGAVAVTVTGGSRIARRWSGVLTACLERQVG